MADVSERELLRNELKQKRICRFCLTQQAEKLHDIYATDMRIKAPPLAMQIMSCAAIEVFANDGLPSWICAECRTLFDHSYRFKQMCKRAESLLRQFPLTGQWPNPLVKPKIPIIFKESNAVNIEILTPNEPNKLTTKKLLNNTNNTTHSIRAAEIKLKSIQLPTNSNANLPKKILNTNAVASPEPPVPVRFKKEIMFDDETQFFLDKVENNEELSIDDVQRLIAATNNEEEFSAAKSSPPTYINRRPKLLNKSSMRILNKEADVEIEPRMSKPQLQCDEDGNVAIVTEILDPNTPYEGEPDPVASAVPIETNVFPCPHCERSFPLLQLRDIHMVNHNRERNFDCSECDKSFFSKYDLQKHSIIHSGDRPFKCSVCDKSFTRAALLQRHEKTHSDIPKFICVYCEMPFLSKEKMEQHTERHRKNRPFKCKLCDKSFAFKQGLERHESVHSRNQPFPCQYCELSFSTSSKLARHLTAHAGKRPYPCKFCAKSFLLSHHLTRHLRSHKEGKVSFTCTTCNNVFKSCQELISHSATHATQTLDCPLCRQKFARQEDVAGHIKQHLEHDTFACAFCDLIFITSQALQNHIDNEHTEDMVAYNEVDDKSQVLHEHVTVENCANQDDGVFEEFQQAIEEFLIDEVPGDTEKQTLITNIKKEDTSYISESPKILSQIVIRGENIQSNYTLLDENDAAVEYKKLQTADEGSALTEQPAKIRKLCTNQTNRNNTEQTSQLRRKIVATATNESTSTNNHQKSQIKIENLKVLASANREATQKSNINNVLNALPKSVSVRRSGRATVNTNSATTTIAANNETTKQSPKPMETSPQMRPQRLSTMRRNSELAANESSTSLLKRSTRNKSPISIAVETSDVNNQAQKKSLMNMRIGDRNIKVQKITMTKSQVDAMKKDGRILIKDGNMVMTQKAAATKQQHN